MTGSAPRRVSVVVPTCNRPTLLREALASIRAIEGADIVFEILVGDNCGSIETQAIAEEFGAQHIAVEQEGAGAARNAGLRAASGDFIAFLDDDDVWLPGNVRAQLSLLDADDTLEGVIGQAITTDPNLQNPGEPWPSSDPGRGERLLCAMMSGFFPQIGTLVVRARVRGLIGEFDESLLGGQDLDWQLRIARRRALGHVSVPSLLFRGREQGTYDALQLRRLGYDRVVFFRHALPEWRIWKSPWQFASAYAGTIQHFYWYFVGVATLAARCGDRQRSRAAVLNAFRVFPGRAIYRIISNRDFRRALLVGLFARLSSADAGLSAGVQPKASSAPPIE